MAIRIILLFLGFLLAGPVNGWTGVSGACSTCHTMHNSQNGAAMVSIGAVGAYAGWNGSGQLTGGGTTTPQEYLLVSDCVGCHSSSTDATIINVSGASIPIVFNTVSPTNPLAGGNFYWVVNDGQGYGHNVRGISVADTNLTSAPGSPGCGNSCHVSLTLTDAATYNNYKNGCRGCHQEVLHHGAKQTAWAPVGEEHGWYRFLGAPPSHSGLGGAGVLGIEDPTWEQVPTQQNHNVYYGSAGDYFDSPQSISRFCSGCHVKFHADGDPNNEDNPLADDNGGGANPWLRHPADAVIPAEDEYTAYTLYKPLVPVGKPLAFITGGGDRNVVTPGTDTVICISCHRAHGSPYPDMLRWNYALMLTGTTGAGNGTGCFVCHSQKDGS